MSLENIPVKRDKNLVVFSHEHHHSLVFCFRLTKVSNADDNTVVSFVSDFWKNHLSVHFENEERLLNTVMKATELSSRFLNEHASIRQLVNEFKGSKTNVYETSIELSELLNSHIRFEERFVFPWLEQNAESKEIKLIGIALNKIEVQSHNFSPQFWKA